MLGKRSRYSWLLWDWNGTLLNDVWLCHEIVNVIVKPHLNREIELDEYRRCFRHPVNQFYQEIGVDLAVVDFNEIARVFHERYLLGYPNCMLHDGVGEILELVHANGLLQGILSALPQAILKPSVLHFGLDKYMCEVISPIGNLAHGKMDEARELVRSRALKADEVLLVGDTDHDAEVARELGFSCVLIARGYQDHARLSAQGYPVIDSVAELRPFLE